MGKKLLRHHRKHRELVKQRKLIDREAEALFNRVHGIGWNKMTPEIYENIISALNKKPLKLSKVKELAKEGGSNWSNSQLRLLFTCMDGVEVEIGEANPTVSLGQRSEQEELIDAIAEIVKVNGGKPIHPRNTIVKAIEAGQDPKLDLDEAENLVNKGFLVRTYRLGE